MFSNIYDLWSPDITDKATDNEHHWLCFILVSARSLWLFFSFILTSLYSMVFLCSVGARQSAVFVFPPALYTLSLDCLIWQSESGLHPVLHPASFKDCIYSSGTNGFFPEMNENVWFSLLWSLLDTLISCLLICKDSIGIRLRFWCLSWTLLPILLVFFVFPSGLWGGSGVNG